VQQKSAVPLDGGQESSDGKWLQVDDHAVIAVAGAVAVANNIMWQD